MAVFIALRFRFGQGLVLVEVCRAPQVRNAPENVWYPPPIRGFSYVQDWSALTLFRTCVSSTCTLRAGPDQPRPTRNLSLHISNPSLDSLEGARSAVSFAKKDVRVLEALLKQTSGWPND